MVGSPSRRRFALPSVVAVAVIALGVGASEGCNDDPFALPCTGIPVGGCPLSHGVACADPACEAVYACHPDNVWQLDHTCPPHADAGLAPAAADAGDAGDADDTPAVRDASIDAPPGAFGGPGCPLLETPDCTLGLALACPQGCCDCQDLFVCEDGAWNLWGACVDGGLAPEGH